MSRVLELRTSPHVNAGNSVDTIMFNVVLALLPVTAFAVYAFGLTALLGLTAAVLSCVAFEQLFCKIAHKPSSLNDWSAVITGLLFGLTLPPALPLWMVVVGSFLGMGIGKHLFGGLGMNAFNPALVGRAVLQATFPVPMTQFMEPLAENRFESLPSGVLTVPLAAPTVDIVSAATPLAALKFDGVTAPTDALALGWTGGSAGETCAVLVCLGGAWLVLRNMMNVRIPLSILSTVFVFSGLLHFVDAERFASPLFMLFSGGLMLGAVFMASDMVGSPMTHPGAILYGVLIGVLVVVIRTWGGMPEGVMYAILLGNAVTPHIDRAIQPRVFGARKTSAEGAT